MSVYSVKKVHYIKLWFPFFGSLFWKLFRCMCYTILFICLFIFLLYPTIFFCANDVDRPSGVVHGLRPTTEWKHDIGNGMNFWGNCIVLWGSEVQRCCLTDSAVRFHDAALQVVLNCRYTWDDLCLSRSCGIVVQFLQFIVPLPTLKSSNHWWASMEKCIKESHLKTALIHWKRYRKFVQYLLLYLFIYFPLISRRVLGPRLEQN